MLVVEYDGDGGGGWLGKHRPPVRPGLSQVFSFSTCTTASPAQPGPGQTRPERSKSFPTENVMIYLEL